jgi:intein-encoded DNA endonuclease-like protein
VLNTRRGIDSPFFWEVIRSFEERVRPYEDVMEFRGSGLNYAEIAQRIEQTDGVRLDPSHVRQWLLGKSSPYGRVHKLKLRKIPELAYVIGVRMCDATRSTNWHHNYMIKLLVTDREFAQEFALCLAIVLHCRIPKVWWYRKRQMWETDVSSIMLYKFLKAPLDVIRPYVEQCKKCTAAFLRAFFDSEGSSSSGAVTGTNTNINLLRYVIFLLDTYFDIKTNDPKGLGPPPGTLKVTKGKTYHVNKQAYTLSMKRKEGRKFAMLVGFTIHRKQEGIIPLVE